MNVYLLTRADADVASVKGMSLKRCRRRHKYLILEFGEDISTVTEFAHIYREVPFSVDQNDFIGKRPMW